MKVSAIHCYSVAATVGVAYMSRDAQSPDWDIHAFTLRWESETNFPQYPPNQSGICNISDFEEDNESDDYSPDLAWDPLTGLLHIVWTGDSGEQNHPYRVMYSTWDGANDPSDPVGIYEDSVDYTGWAPRIAIGACDVGPCENDIVGIVYSAYSEDGNAAIQDRWHVGAAYWAIDLEEPGDAHFMHFDYQGEDEYDAAGYPRLDLSPRGGDDKYGSIVFTQYLDDYETYQTIEVNNVRNDFWVVEGYVEDADEEFNGAVAIQHDTEDPTASISHLEWYDEYEYWYVTAGYYLLEEDASIEGWLPIDSDIGGDRLEKFGDFIDFLQIETFQTADIVTVNEDNSYWLGYCNKIDYQACAVIVAYGNPTI